PPTTDPARIGALHLAGARSSDAGRVVRHGAAVVASRRRQRTEDGMDPIAEDWQRAVAVVAHPDDLEYGVASAVARWTGQGKDITYVLATSGEAGIDGMEPAEAGPLREEEERRSAAVVGVSRVDLLGHPDRAVEYGVALRR